jgi:hypothetical protein
MDHWCDIYPLDKSSAVNFWFMLKFKHMRSILSIAPTLALFFSASSYAINAQYAKQLDRSGCTQVTELQGCDIHKSKTENAKVAVAAQVVPKSTSAPTLVSNSVAGSSPYTGNWIATGTNGAMVAKIRIDTKEKVWVNGIPVKAKRSDGSLVFQYKAITYNVQGDRRLKDEGTWYDWDAKTQGPINSE